jgi:hypothetical protein
VIHPDNYLSQDRYLRRKPSNVSAKNLFLSLNFANKSKATNGDLFERSILAVITLISIGYLVVLLLELCFKIFTREDPHGSVGATTKLDIDNSSEPSSSHFLFHGSPREPC